MFYYLIMEKIEKPKIFISYCWTNSEYINKVVEFAQRLRSDGIDVVLDQFAMKLGNDTNNFMEKCVNDSSITNVLILLSPDYKTKADLRKGGAGIETQIISGEVYSNVENTKFIPILFEKRGEDTDACIPTYLKQRRWLDMSEDSNFEERYVELVKTLYGRERFIQIPLGSKPEWVDQKSSAIADSQIIINNYKNLKKESDDVKAFAVSFDYLAALFKNVKEKVENSNFYDLNEFDKNYKLFDSFKYPFLAFLSETKYDSSIGKKLHQFFTVLLKIISESKTNHEAFVILSKILLHELFIETIAILIQGQNFKSINFLTNSSYVDYLSYSHDLSLFKDIFYSCTDTHTYNISQNLGRMLHSESSKGMYYSGFAEYWKRNIPVKFLSFLEFIDADCLLTNISISLDENYWFALSYCYLNDRSTSLIKSIAISLKSETLASEYFDLFGWKTYEDAKKSLDCLNEYSIGHEVRLSYSGTFYGIPLLSDFLKKDEIGTKR